MRVAKEMCRRHPELVQASGTASPPRDIAMKIILSELAQNQGIELRYDMHSPDSKSGSPAVRDDGLSPYANAAHASAALGRPGAFQPTPMHGTLEPQNALDQCPYCDEPKSRYCKETGRRHETAQGRAVRFWRHIYRQLSIASNFINTARLSKPNTCTEEYAVELDLDSI